MRNTPLAIAVHEAGHAVAQLANPPAPWINSIAVTGLPDGLLGLVDTQAMWQPYMATMTVAPDVADLYRELAWKDVIFYLAGPIAELRWRRLSRAAIWFDGCRHRDHCLGDVVLEAGSDLDRVRARLLWAYPDGAQEAFDRAWLEAEELVSRKWRGITTLGRLLAARGRIEGEELIQRWTRLAC